MASSDTGMVNSAEKNSESVSQPKVEDNHNISKGRRRRQRGTTAQGQTPSTNPANAGSSSSKDALPITESKPKNWEASLTMAEIKAMKSEEAKKKHNEQFPPRANRDPVKKPKKARQVAPPAAPNAKPVQESNPGENINAPAQKPAMDQSGIRYEQPPPPCGIPGCPVRAYHEPRRYVYNEAARPAMIKMIQRKSNDEASEADWNTLDRFFLLHERFEKAAKGKGRA
ncbi:MAG: hypothetical protein HETSPECPRED_009684 [Heterodermia speciosa]|uniref:Uncharacterized protein n=1 Tax=Heterodermia speciosa TaxID=116794 RepID=A0A8H3IZG8_9LECA|nr:MAG: hypothetical protein HETSPECPRED_009684 [Heterodermia speciosa]